MADNNWLNRSTNEFVVRIDAADMTSRYGSSVDFHTYASNAEWIYDPNLSAVTGFPSKYWIITGDVVTLMDQTARDAVDAAELVAALDAERATAVAQVDASPSEVGVRERAMIELHNKRINFATNRIIELQDRVQAMLDSSGGVANMRIDGLAVSISATATRTKADAVADYKADINAGNNDT